MKLPLILILIVSFLNVIFPFSLWMSYLQKTPNNEKTKWNGMTKLIKQKVSLTNVIGKYLDVSALNLDTSRSVCPFHDDQNPSMLINEGPGYYYCFSCGATGDLIDFLSQCKNISKGKVISKCIELLESNKSIDDWLDNDHVFFSPQNRLFSPGPKYKNNNILSTQSPPLPSFITNIESTFQEMVRALESIKLDQNQSNDEVLYMKQLLQKAALFYQSRLIADLEASNLRIYLKSRGISVETAMTFQLGFAPDSKPKLNIQKLTIEKTLFSPVNNNNKANIVGIELKEMISFLQNHSFSSWVSHHESSKRNRGLPQELLQSHLVASGLTLNLTSYSSKKQKSSTYQPIKDRFINRLMIPIRNIQGEVIAFGSREIPGTTHRNQTKSHGKYTNSPSNSLFIKKQCLFGIDIAKPYCEKENFVLIVEGYMDVISLHEVGIKNVVASMGTAFTLPQILLAANLSTSGTIILLLDNDSAGETASNRALTLFNKLNTTIASRGKEISKYFPLKHKEIILKIATLDLSNNFIQNNFIKEKKSFNTTTTCHIFKDCSELCEYYSSKDVKAILTHIVTHPVSTNKISFPYNK